ncbi:MAG: ABC transporter ATP-binding protein [candidate division Zixibacteria bacterium]|nr:ABC transporter ATP-binding protein [candidate division Zixibacteria bacterium]
MNDQPGVPMIVAEGLCKYYGPFVAVEDISFSIPRGQVVAFLGPNGAGKSTTMKILSGFLAASKGSASIGGHDITTDRLAAARILGYLPENGPLYENMTPRELLDFFAEARGMSKKYAKNRQEVVIDQCAVAEALDKPISKLSRGYRQRVGLAIALLHDPEALIMDEPTAGLDPNQIRDFRINIKRLGKSKTILISTHILQEVEAVADRVLFIHEGRLVFDGTPAELRSDTSLEQSFYRLTDAAVKTSGNSPAITEEAAV